MQDLCIYHPRNKAKYFCLEEVCAADSRACCAVCIAESIHQNHKKEQIKVFQPRLNELIIQQKTSLAQQLRIAASGNLDNIQNLFQEELDKVIQQISLNNPFLKTRDHFEEKAFELERKYCQSQTFKEVKGLIEKNLYSYSKVEGDLAMKVYEQAQVELFMHAFVPKLDRQFNMDEFENAYKTVKSPHKGGIKIIQPLDDEHFATAGEDKSLRIWKIEAQELILEMNVHKHQILDVKETNYYQQYSMATCDERGIYFWDYLKGEQLIKLQTESQSCLLPWVSPYFISAGGSFKEKKIKIWNLFKGKVQEEISGHQDGILCIENLDLGNVFVTGGKDKAVRIWKSNKFGSGGVSSIENKHPGMVYKILKLESEKIITGCSDNQARLFYWPNGELLRVFSEFKGGLSDFIKINENFIIFTDIKGQLLIWDYQNDLIEERNRINTDSPIFVIKKLDSRRFLTGGKTIKVWQ